MTGAEVSAIVVNWNTRELLEECLTSLRKHAGGRSMEIIVVDNASSDGSADMVARDWPAVRLIVNPDNVGYQRANNQAVRVSHGKFLLLINADALLTAGCLEVLLGCLEQDESAAVAGPRLVYGDGRWQRWTAGRQPTLRTATNYFLFLERLSPGLEGVYLSRDVQAPFQADWVSSACMLVRRSALDEVGLMDEGFFAYMDDVDICARLRQAGWRVWYCPQARAVHYMGQSSRALPGSVSPMALRSFNRYFRLQHGRRAVQMLQGIEAVGFGVRTLAYAACGLARPHARARLFARARAHWTYCKVSLEADGDN